MSPRRITLETISRKRGAYRFEDLTMVEVHAYRNVGTGQLVELKTKIGTWKP